MDQLETRPDPELLRRALAGEEAAFLLLYQRLKGGIYRYAFYMTNSRTTAEEVTQEVFLSLITEARRYREERGEVAAFAFGIARNFVRRIVRRERPYQPLPGDDAVEKLSRALAPESQTAHGHLIRNELVEQVQAAIASLPDHYRQVVVLCDLCELSYTEAASRLGCPLGTVRSRLNRAHALLAQKLQPLRNNPAEIGPAGAEGCLI